MAEALRDVIRDLTSRHLDAGHLVMGQCLSAVGWVANTLPERRDMTELPCSDVAGAGFAVGAALAGRRPIYIVRYQGFQWFNAALVVNYAAKSKAMWGVPCPLLVRSIAMEGRIGPVAGSSHHALFYRMPGVKILSPMTPGEWRRAYAEFMEGDGVIYLSEHRAAFGNTQELLDVCPKHPEVMLFPISITRFAAAEVANHEIGAHHVFQLKPFAPSAWALEALRQSRYGGVVLDDDYPDGAARAYAHRLSGLTGVQVRVLGLEDRTAGFARCLDNLPPNVERLCEFLDEIRR